MKNCLVMGTGRSGTSLLAGTLAGAGYYMGDRMMPPTAGNPKGYFESFDIQNINEDILAGTINNRPAGLWGKFFGKHIPLKSQRWLARVPLDMEMKYTPDIQGRIREKTSKGAYCFKDPRFCYTLPVWRPFLSQTVFFCVFRQPSFTADSILLECQREKYLKTIRINRSQIYQLWNLMYSHVLEIHLRQGDWLFLHYDQIFTSRTLDMIEEIIGAPLDRSFPEKNLVKQHPEISVPAKTVAIYRELCSRAKM